MAKKKVTKKVGSKTTPKGKALVGGAVMPNPEVLKMEKEIRRLQRALESSDLRVDNALQYVNSFMEAHSWINNHEKYDYKSGYRNGYKVALYDVYRLLGYDGEAPVTKSRLLVEVLPE